MLQRIKNAVSGKIFNNQFSGTVETAGQKIKLNNLKTHFQIDECYIGGSEANKHTVNKFLNDLYPVK